MKFAISRGVLGIDFELSSMNVLTISTSLIPRLFWAAIAKALCLGLALVPLQALVADTSTDTLQDQRYLYELAKSQLKKKDYAAFQKSREGIGDYPLAPYLDYQVASRSLSPLEKSPVESFINQHKGSYLGERMHRRYLHLLAKQADWPALIYWYAPEVANKEISCKWLQARVETGDTTALESVPSLWLSADSQPRACDELFSAWFKSDSYRDEFAWQRFLLAMSKSRRGLARYLASSLPSKHYKHYVDLVWELDSRPYRIKDMSRFRLHTPEMQQIVAFGIQKYARTAPVTALNLWEQYEASAIVDEKIITDTKISLVSRLLVKKEMPDVVRMLASSPSIRQTSVIEKLIRAQLREQNWPEVLSAIALLPDQDQNSDRWQYWHTRAQQALGSISAEEAKSRFRTLAQQRSFYGFLAADIVKTSYAMRAQATEFPQSVLDKLAERPALRRAKELWLTGHTAEAHAEWYYGIDKLSARELAAAGVMAHDWGWYDRGIQAMIAGKHWDHLNVRFPLAYKEQILNAAVDTELAPAFIFAIARQESAMSEQAKSSAGARGLMQLMPATAKQTARKKGIKHRTEDLYRAEHNIQLGSQYLDELLNKFNGNRILAAAAYNAGPHRVSRWTQDQAGLDYDIWIETIPFRETRGYVQNVLTYAVIYSMRMGEPAPFITNTEANQKL